MPKKKTLTMWGLWNYGRLFAVEERRKDCRAEAAAIVIGGKAEADKMFKSGAFRITKLAVREI